MGVGKMPAPSLFNKGSSSLSRLIIYVAISLILLCLDLRFNYLNTIKQAVSVVVYPFQLIAAQPAYIVSNIRQYFSSVLNLQIENRALRASQVEVTQQLLTLEFLKQENHELRQLLNLSDRQHLKGISASILSDGSDPFSQTVILNRGSLSGIQRGAAVVDSQGLIGQVLNVYPNQTEVSLVTNNLQMVPVMLEGSQHRGVLYGVEKNNLILRFIASDAKVSPGDKVLTSGMGGQFLPGIPVAIVKQVHLQSSDSHFLKILCKPISEIASSRFVLVLNKNERDSPVSFGQNSEKTGSLLEEQ